MLECHERGVWHHSARSWEDRGSPSKAYPKGRAYRSTGHISTPVVLAFSTIICLLLSVAGYNAFLLYRRSVLRHAVVRQAAIGPRPIAFKVGTEKYSQFLSSKPPAAPVTTPVSLSLRHLESQMSSMRQEGGGLWIEKLRDEPQIFLLHNFITEDEASHLMALAMPHLDKALVVEPGHTDQTAAKARTNSAAWLKRGGDETVATIERRIGYATGTRVEQGEDLQVLHYDVGEEFTPHHDYFDPTIYSKQLSTNGGHRMVTVIVCLQGALAGGKTSFPRAGLNVSTSVGDALLFYNLLPDGKPDVMSQHAGLPVVSGEKWVATKWLHIRDFASPSVPQPGPIVLP